MNQEQRIAKLEKEVADLKELVAAVTTTSWNPQIAAKYLSEALTKSKIKRGISN